MINLNVFYTRVVHEMFRNSTIYKRTPDPVFVFDEDNLENHLNDDCVVFVYDEDPQPQPHNHFITIHEEDGTESKAADSSQSLILKAPSFWDSITKITYEDDLVSLQASDIFSYDEISRDFSINRDDEPKKCTRCGVGVLYCVGGIFFLVSVGSLLLVSTSEMRDGIKLAADKIPITPFPALFGISLAFIPKSPTQQSVTLLGNAGYALGRDSYATYEGFKDTKHIIQTRQLPEDMAADAKSLTARQTRNTLIIGVILVGGSLFFEVMNGYSYITDNDTPTTDNDPLPSYLQPSDALSDAAVCWSTCVFIFNEGAKTPGAILKWYAGNRKPISLSHELLSLTVRVPASIGASLFALSATAKNFTITSPEGLVTTFAFSLIFKGTTDFLYNGDYSREVFDRAATRIENILLGEYDAETGERGERILPDAAEIFSSSLSTSIAGMLSYYQACLTIDYFDDLTSNEFLKGYILLPMILFYSLNLWLGYGGALNEPFDWFFSKIFCRDEQPERLTELSSTIEPPAEHKTPARQYGQGTTLFDQDLRQPLLESKVADPASPAFEDEKERPPRKSFCGRLKCWS
jgi:hypothetical protein